MLKKEYKLFIISLIAFPLAIQGLMSCGKSTASDNTSINNCQEYKSIAPLLDGKNPNPLVAAPVLAATPCTEVTFQKFKEDDPQWAKVKIKNTEVWIDRGHLLNCDDPKLNQPCKVK